MSVNFIGGETIDNHQPAASHRRKFIGRELNSQL